MQTCRRVRSSAPGVQGRSTTLPCMPWLIQNTDTQPHLQARVQQRARRAQAVADGVRQLEARAIRRPVQVDVRLRQVLIEHLSASAPTSRAPWALPATAAPVS